MTILSSQKVKNAKHRFWLQKGVKNLIRQDFLILHPRMVRGFVCYFCLKMSRTLIFLGVGGFRRKPLQFEICNFQAKLFGPFEFSPTHWNSFKIQECLHPLVKTRDAETFCIFKVSLQEEVHRALALRSQEVIFSHQFHLQPHGETF